MKKSTLFYVELMGINDIQILLVSKPLIKWIEGKITAPLDLQLAWESQEDKHKYKTSVWQIIKSLEPGTGGSPRNDRALSIPEEATIASFCDVRMYAEWYAKNKNKYNIKDGYHGAIY